MWRKFSRLALAVLLFSFVVFDLALATVVDFGEAAPVAMGVTFAQVMLLSVWVALAPLGLFTRMATGFTLTSLVCLSVVAFALRDGERDAAISVGGAIFAQWFAIQAPLWVIRLAGGWRLGWPDEETPATTTKETQFGLQQLFVWTALVAITLGLARWLLPSESMSGGVRDVKGMIAILIVVSVFGSLLALPIIWSTLVRRRIALWLPVAVACCVVLAVAEGVVLRKALGGGVDEEIFWALNAIQFVAATGSLLLVRGSGIRLLQTIPS